MFTIKCFDIYVMTWNYNVWNSKWTCVYIFAMTLFVIIWHDGYMVNALGCHHKCVRGSILLCHLVHDLKLTCIGEAIGGAKNINTIFSWLQKYDCSKIGPIVYALFVGTYVKMTWTMGPIWLCNHMNVVMKIMFWHNVMYIPRATQLMGDKWTMSKWAMNLRVGWNLYKIFQPHKQNIWKMFPSHIMEYFCRMDEYVNTWQEGFAMWTNTSHQHLVMDLCWIQTNSLCQH
jgi:hypothetical protein